MAGHTPGPWSVSTQCRDLIQSGGENGCVVAQALGPVLGSPQHSANARLIAAAPDLLEALSGCIENVSGETVEVRAARARAAIAKARGDQS